MSETIIQRIAEAMAANENFPTWRSVPSILQDEYRSNARAAVQAMTEPTEAMLFAVVPDVDDVLLGGLPSARAAVYKAAADADRMEVRSKWQDMILAALAEER